MSATANTMLMGIVMLRRQESGEFLFMDYDAYVRRFAARLIGAGV